MKKMKWVNGTATLEAAAMSANAPVKGKVTFKITQMVGGF